MDDLFIPVILGTARPGRRSAGVAEHVAGAIKQRGMLTDIIDVADHPLTATGIGGDHVDAYKERVAASEGFVIVTPEYNHGYPGELKLLLDSDHQGYARKPVGFVSVSAGRIGGARVIEQLRLVTTALRMVPVSPAVHVPDVATELDPSTGFVSESLESVLGDMLEEVEWHARALGAARS